MGLMQFLVPDRSFLVEGLLSSAHMTGLDGIPWPCRIVATSAGIMIDRPAGESGNVHVAWRVPSHGEIVLSTASLMERTRPYILPLELARGTLNRLRNHLAAWESMGMVISADVSADIGFSQEAFSQAASQQAMPAVAAQYAQRSLAHALDALEALCVSYARQALDARLRQTPRLATLFGVRIDHFPLDAAIAQTLFPAFNAVEVSLNWAKIEPEDNRFDWRSTDAAIEACLNAGWRVAAGPIFEPTTAALPKWLYLYEDEVDQLSAYVARFVEQVVARYSGKVHLWHGAGRANIADSLHIAEDAKLRLMLRAVETVRKFDQRTPLVVSFDQVWGEHMLVDSRDLSPLHFADALVRADVGLQGLGIEINLGYTPGGTLPRDLLAISQQIDRWSMFGLPLLVFLTVPSGGGEGDSAAQIKCQALSSRGSGPPTPASQRELVERLVPMLLAKQAVQGFFWNQITDNRPHDYPQAGLFDTAGQPKPALPALGGMRQRYLV